MVRLTKSRPTLAVALLALLVLSCASSVSATIYFYEPFDTMDGWVTSSFMPDYGRVELSSGKNYINGEKEKGLRLVEDGHFYAVSKELPTPVDNKGKNFVVSYSLKNEHNVRCAGAYLKFLNLPDQNRFSGVSPYYLMFGPDRCGGTRKLHIIFGHGGKNLQWQKNIPIPDDEVTHVYTLEVTPENTYRVYLDMELKESGSLDEDWKFLAPKEIDDPTDIKPEDWVDEAEMVDPDDRKPDDWDNEPEMIVDENAEKPENWNDEEDGIWERPMRPNPAYRGTWSPRKIANPAYKGPWKARQIPNPKYAPDPTLYRMTSPITHVAIDVWQVEAGSIFDNIIIGDSVEEVLKLVDETYGVMAKEEMEMMKARHEQARAEMEASRKAMEEEEREL